MKVIMRLLLICLAIGVGFPQAAYPGGDKGKDPYEVGEKYFAQNDHRRAMTYYRKALGQNDVRAYYRMGIIFEDSGKDRDALRHYRRYLELGKPDARWNDAAARVNRLEKKLTAESARSSVLLERGKSLYAEGKYRDAEKVLLDAAREDGNNPEIHYYLGEVYMALEEYTRATTEYNKAKELY
ncbi:MAG: tetratricopeptide repeat protein [bacterium]|nr:tetratricopeptide repeat protein [bacterium]